ncbi:MAG: hypothetical protein ACYC61_11935 [Isosphaeraceae bacterium]
MVKCKNCQKPLNIGEPGLPCPHCGSMERVTTASDQATSGEIAEAAAVLARKHYEIEAGLTQIFRITDAAEATVPRGAPIKLLEVNKNTPESGIMPLHFGPAPASGIPYASVIIEVTPNEFEKIRSNELKLPHGWSIGEELPRISVPGRS